MELRTAILDFARRAARWPGAAPLIECPCCGDRNINNEFGAELEPGFANCSHGGITLNILCGHGHSWHLRLTNWFMPPEYAATVKKKLAQQMDRPDGQQMDRPDAASPKVAIKSKMRGGKKLPDKISWRGDELDFGEL